MIKAGKLPVLEEYFWNDGAHAKAAITTFPSASAPAYQSFITGLLAGRSGISYLQWYDRVKEEEIDYLGMGFLRISNDMWNWHATGNPPITLFEKLEGHPTAAIYSEIFRGASYQEPKIPFGALSDTFITNREDRLDIRAMDRVDRLCRLDISQIPRFMLVGLYSADVLQHLDGTASEDAGLALRQFDIYLGQLIDMLKNKGIYDKTYIIVAADHGMHDIEHSVDLDPLFKKAGLHAKHTTLKKEKSDLYFSERGVASAHIYVKGESSEGGGLDGTPSLDRMLAYPLAAGRKVDIIEMLRRDEGLSLVIARNGRLRSEVYSKDCHSTIEESAKDGRYQYSYKIRDCDPLNYCGDKKIKKLCDGKPHGDREWLSSSFDKRYPDAVVQLSQIFDDGRAGDIFVVADDKGGFYKSKSATHGSLIDEDMNVPLLVRGPGVAKGEFGPIRTVDMFPTMLRWFGLKNDVVNDGTDTGL
jgi:predicted AlkP superfamily pyrophosphatase or phosphodiesterase